MLAPDSTNEKHVQVVLYYTFSPTPIFLQHLFIPPPFEMTATTTSDRSNVALGLSVPPYTPHAISVSLPTWRDNVDYEKSEKRVVDSMVSGYPRFFIHLSIQKVCSNGFDQIRWPHLSLPSVVGTYVRAEV